MESPSAPDTTLLRDAVPEQKDRMRILAVLADKTMGQVEGLHLTLASLDAREVLSHVLRGILLANRSNTWNFVLEAEL